MQKLRELERIRSGKEMLQVGVSEEARGAGQWRASSGRGEGMRRGCRYWEGEGGRGREGGAGKGMLCPLTPPLRQDASASAASAAAGQDQGGRGGPEKGH